MQFFNELGIHEIKEYVKNIGYPLPMKIRKLLIPMRFKYEFIHEIIENDNKFRHKIHNKKWYSNKQIKYNHKNYYETNKIQILNQQRNYYETNKIQILNRQRNYYEANKIKIIERVKNYEANNREKINARRKLRYAKLKLNKFI